MPETVTIDDVLMTRLHEESARRGITLSAVVELALSHFLHCEALPELPTFESGGALIDISNHDYLYRAMEGR